MAKATGQSSPVKPPELHPVNLAELEIQRAEVEQVLAANPKLGALDWPTVLPPSHAPEAEDADLIEQAERSGDIDFLWRAAGPRPAAEWGSHSATTEAGRAAWGVLAQAERDLRDSQGSGYGRGRASREEIEQKRRAVIEAKAGVLLSERGLPPVPAVAVIVLFRQVADLKDEVRGLRSVKDDVETLALTLAAHVGQSTRKAGA